MRTVSVTAHYERKLNTGDYSSVTLSTWATVELEPGDTAEAALAYGVDICRAAVKEAAAPFVRAATTGQSDDDAPEDGEYEDAPTTTVKTTPPTPAATKPQPPFASGPQSDEDTAISEANGDFANVAAAFLGTDALTIKRRMGELRLSVPRTGQQRIEVYRALKADMGAADDIMAAAGTQPSLVTVAQPVTDYQE